jgi:general secretion pathway protein A
MELRSKIRHLTFVVAAGRAGRRERSKSSEACREPRGRHQEGVTDSMYLEHFQLKKEPFGMAPDPDLVWLGGQHARVFDTLREGIFDRDGCVILTGDIGTGKTALVKRITRQEGVAAVFITVSGPTLSGLDFYNILATELRMNRRFDRHEEFIADFSRVLSKAFGAVQKVILVIDEAQRLTREALKDLAALGDLRPHGKRLLAILLVGQLDLDALATSKTNDGVLPKIAARCSLEPLTEADVHAYVAHRLKAAGREQPLFQTEALQAIHALSKGFPRLINIICDHALLYGYSANLQQIDSGVIRDCSRDLSVALDLEEPLDDPPPKPAAANAPDAAPAPAKGLSSAGGWRPWIYLAAALAAALGVFYFIGR